MVIMKDLKKIDKYLYEIPKTFRSDMKVPARFYTDEVLLEAALEDKSLEQLVNITTLKGIVGYGFGMPDIHQGYGFPIGGVAATKLPHGVISPGGVGYDINCGVRSLLTGMSFNDIKPYLGKIMDGLFKEVPSGVGSVGKLKLNKKELDEILNKGSKWVIEKGYGQNEDLEATESYGSLTEADYTAVSKKAKKRGYNQVGTLGAGNHFLEVQVVNKIFDKTIAEEFGIKKDNVLVMIHCGSRGLGHQVASDYIELMRPAMDKYKIKVPDPELACVPFDSPEGQQYFKAMSAAANFAWANRQVIAYLVRKVWKDVLGKEDIKQLYDVAHNIAKVEIHGKNKLCVQRKGATRAFGPEHLDLPLRYQKTGQPVVIPGSMGTSSYILVGTYDSEQAFGSTCHGAGRVLSRTKAKKTIWGEDVRKRLEYQGIKIRSKSNVGLSEEAPEAYKDIDRVIKIVHTRGIARKVAQLKPLGVIKG